MKTTLDVSVLVLNVAMIFAVRNVVLASAVAITFLRRVECTAFAMASFLTELPPVLGVVAHYRRRPARSDLPQCAGAT